MTAYPLFPNGQGKKPPKAVTGCVSREGTADTLVPLSVVLKCSMHKIWRGFRVHNELHLVTNKGI